MRLKSDKKEKYISFGKRENLAFTKPVWFSLFGEKKTVKSWKNLYISFCNILVKDYALFFEREISLAENSDKKPWILKQENAHLMTTPKAIDGGYVLETNYDSTNILNRIKSILKGCGIKYENVTICYENNRKAKKGNVVAKGRINYIREDEREFSNWLLKKQNMSGSTVGSYISALRKVESFITESKRYERSIYELSPDEIHMLFSNSIKDLEFLKAISGIRHSVEAAFKDRKTKFKEEAIAKGLLIFEDDAVKTAATSNLKIQSALKRKDAELREIVRKIENL